MSKWLSCLLLIFSVTVARAEPIVIDDDSGGQISTYLEWYKRLRDSRTPVVLRGVCVSACTLVLILPKEQVCVESTASLGFHSVSIGELPEPGLTEALIKRYYPIEVKNWLHGKKLNLNPIVIMTADEMVSLGIFPLCH